MSDNVKDDNPAGRLYLILDSLERVADDKIVFRDLLSKKFNLESDDAITVTSVHLSLLNLVKQTREMVDRLELGPLFLDPMNELQVGFSSVGLNHQWNNYRRFITPVNMNSLKFISEKLSQTSESEERIPENSIDELLKDVGEIIKTVRESDLLITFKKQLLERLEEIQQALWKYKLGFNGNDIFADEMAHTLGFVILYQSELENVKKRGEKGKKIYDKLGKLFVSISKIVATVGIKELAEEAITHLPQLADGIKDVFN